MKTFSHVVSILTERGKTISTMESCTGGGVCNAITNVEGASEVFQYSAITYSNEYKIKMGVSSDVIDKYSVYSMETAHSMAYAIACFANSNYGVGITGKLRRVDKDNPFGSDNVVFISVYDRDRDQYFDSSLEAICQSRSKNKDLVIEEVIRILEEDVL